MQRTILLVTYSLCPDITFNITRTFLEATYAE